jgi:hypothetical protein
VSARRHRPAQVVQAHYPAGLASGSLTGTVISKSSEAAETSRSRTMVGDGLSELCPFRSSQVGAVGRSRFRWGWKGDERAVGVEVDAVDAVVVQQLDAVLVGAPGKQGGQACDWARTEPLVVPELAESLPDERHPRTPPAQPAIGTWQLLPHPDRDADYRHHGDGQQIGVQARSARTVAAGRAWLASCAHPPGGGDPPVDVLMLGPEVHIVEDFLDLHRSMSSRLS